MTSRLDLLRSGIPPSASSARWNRWDQIAEAPAARPWPKIDVVIPYYNQPDQLGATLEGLARQSLPPSAFTVTIADDGSDEKPIIPPRAAGLDLTVVTQDRDGPRRSHARNLGASQHENPVVLFLDADMVPLPNVVERHADWHRRTDAAVTLSRRRHAPGGTEHNATFIEAIAGGTLDRTETYRRASYPAFVEGHLIRTDYLRSGADDIFYVLSAGCLGVSRTLFEASGGFDETFTGWGGEDLELGFRLFTRGADVIPVLDAECVHLGAGTSEHAGREIDQRATLGDWIPHPSLRPVTERRGRIPQVVVTIDRDRASAAAVDFTEKQLGAERFRDFELGEVAPDDAIDQAPMHIHLLASAAMPSVPITRLWSALRAANGDAALAQLGPNGAYGHAVLRRANHRSPDLRTVADRFGQITVATDGEPPDLPTVAHDTATRTRAKDLFARLPTPLVRPTTAAASAALTAARRFKSK